MTNDLRSRALVYFAAACLNGALLSIGPGAFAKPSPIVRDPDNDFNWIVDSGAPFPSSGISLELRRFVQLPANSNGSPARINKMSYAPGVAGLFVVNSGEQWDPTSEGIVYHISSDGTSLTEALDVSDVYVLPRDQFAYDHQGGLRSVTFHPQFNQPGAPGYGKLYTTQSVARPTDVSGLTYLGEMNPALGPLPNSDRIDGAVVEWTAAFDSSGHFAGIDAGSHREVYRVAAPDRQHPIKEAAFNPYAKPGDEDYGLLYVLHPDGNSPQAGTTAGTGQDGSDALGSIVRINPLQDGASSYSIATSNPFVGEAQTLDEIYALGFRDHHTIAFTKAGDLLVSDIGNNRAEEINLITAGANYGWSVREGTFLFNNPGTADLPADDAANGFTYPAVQYGHQIGGDAHAIAGGYAIENGSPLDGQMIFGDFASPRSSLMTVSISEALQAITSGSPDDLAPAEIKSVDILLDDDDDPITPSILKMNVRDLIDDEPTYDESGRTDIRFGQGPSGEIYLLNKRNGWIYLVTNSLPREGDFDLDGDADADDLHAWESGFGASRGALRAQGDADYDEIVDGADFMIWQAAYGAPMAAAATDVLAIPEPSSSAIGLLAGWAGLLASRRFSKRRLSRASEPSTP